MFSVAGVAKAQEKEGSQPIHKSGGEPKNLWMNEPRRRRFAGTELSSSEVRRLQLEHDLKMWRRLELARRGFF
jgi:hypothetical protein